MERRDAARENSVQSRYRPAGGSDRDLVSLGRRKNHDGPDCVSYGQRQRVSFQARLREATMSKQADLLQGTLEMLILKSISLQPMHGYGILVRIHQLSGDRLQIQQGSLYPALYRLETRGLIRAEWGESENNRKAKYYRLTPE